MNFDDFFLEAKKSNLEINFKNVDGHVTHRISNEALFHLPLIAMTILLLSSTRVKPNSSEVGQLIGECFERTFAGFKGSSQHLGWSANLRMRTVKALTFLETANLVEVRPKDSRINAKSRGKKIINEALSGDSNLSFNLALLRNNYVDLKRERDISQGLLL